MYANERTGDDLCTCISDTSARVELFLRARSLLQTDAVCRHLKRALLASDVLGIYPYEAKTCTSTDFLLKSARKQKRSAASMAADTGVDY